MLYYVNYSHFTMEFEKQKLQNYNINELIKMGYKTFVPLCEINYTHVYIMLKVYGENMKFHIKNNNIDVVKFIYLNKLADDHFSLKKSIAYSVYYNRFEILQFLHLECSKKTCLNTSYHISKHHKIEPEMHNWLSKNCCNYNKPLVTF